MYTCFITSTVQKGAGQLVNNVFTGRTLLISRCLLAYVMAVSVVNFSPSGFLWFTSACTEFLWLSIDMSSSSTELSGCQLTSAHCVLFILLASFGQLFISIQLYFFASLSSSYYQPDSCFVHLFYYYLTVLLCILVLCILLAIFLFWAFILFPFICTSQHP